MAADPVLINVNRKIASLFPIQPEHCICKVPYYLRNVDNEAYEPHQCAIGPYHSGKVHLKAMEELKYWYLQKLLEEKEYINVSIYIMAMRNLERKARNCYKDPVRLESDDFVQMMLLDGCFILLEMIEIVHKVDFTRKILEFFKHVLPDLRYFKDNVKPIGEIRHLLDLIHEYWSPSLTEIKEHLNMEGNMDSRCTCATKLKFKRMKEDRKGNMDSRRTRCATELQEAGIKFKKMKGACYGSNTNLITDYVIFMNCLINSAKDVEILAHCEIVDNCLGDDEAVATMFNRLTYSVFYSSIQYLEVSYEVNAYCRRRRNKWLANLNHNYFNNPWALISVLSATVIVLLTLLQTIFSGFAL
ncbi:UPF0481 protein At3g47200-like [Durio zibethinus]|uniref:UPF0481 protein At3g47200-like n=1 Tax=Durio zibethinus TaxID=66656 RepID=A0A6P5X343_DURZI|nr:UPF0481 protein At3g47200-like [Durio zibethinus]